MACGPCTMTQPKIQPKIQPISGHTRLEGRQGTQPALERRQQGVSLPFGTLQEQLPTLEFLSGLPFTVGVVTPVILIAACET